MNLAHAKKSLIENIQGSFGGCLRLPESLTLRIAKKGKDFKWKERPRGDSAESSEGGLMF